MCAQAWSRGFRMMNRGTAFDEDGGNNKKGREKKGFKVDRFESFQRRRLKKSGAKDAHRNSGGGNSGRVRAIKFDENARREYLLTMHKCKNERRVKAFVDARQKTRRENARARRAQREEARQAYNRFAAVPILPNFTYQLPQDDGDAESESESEHDTREENDVVDVTVNRRHSAIAAGKTVHVIPTAMRGGSSEETTSDRKSHLDDDFVTVEVKPLFGGLAAASGSGGATTTPKLPANDFSDLPAVVEQELLRLRKETKGPSKTKPRLRMLKELAKIRKIKKHSQKGHGKKTAKGKRKNRR
ncbi:hypothetical protein, conserved [Trypanosoma cruzi]|uniref:Nucleolar protein 12 n=2 Tax=Trypanosoma cruzi TaxID=5693 RepID=Q4DCW1_TRYCC|nr:hypothetical protein, conserved [Trypanosoma cruzi]EAN90355.1 hypothetical protein, conserved [Trypanosoma cruzi]|eukprot:XP_812206.1 hypothetical protein [Trypanosoma cruzi strain CL Brener]